ncbi:DUF397 domain-containing protein, partial [Streptomyces sp. SID335]|uniref:DUF397 domain-containing protein n=1 Tax=Streptomyces sp. SID335 TaxID=2690261 RepID=UPI00136C9574
MITERCTSVIARAQGPVPASLSGYHRAYLPYRTAVRDSKDPAGPALAFDGTAWRRFVDENKGARARQPRVSRPPVVPGSDPHSGGTPA